MLMSIDRSVRLRVVALAAGIVVGAVCLTTMYVSVQAQGAPRYKFDAEWPKLPLPKYWKFGGVTGLAVDKDDNVWVLNRPQDLDETENYATLKPPTAECCIAAPTIVAFDRQGNVIASFEAPQGHGLEVDRQGNVWIGQDTVRKYSRDGKLLGEIAHVPDRQPGGNNATPAAIAAFRQKYPPDTKQIVGGLEEIRADDDARDLYAIDNYLNGRVMVYDMDTLQFKRGWGAYGKPLAEISTTPAGRYDPSTPPPRDFVSHVTLNVSRDGMVYVADRQGNRIQVFTKDGKYLKEFRLATSTGERGSAGGVAFSSDRQQRYLYISDIQNNTIWFLNRDDGKVLGRLGSAGNNGGQFHGLHMIAVDSRGNIYTGEVQDGERVQRFVPVN
jgi:DNA-binding beta-propeller fold protein YncE